MMSVGAVMRVVRAAVSMRVTTVTAMTGVTGVTMRSVAAVTLMPESAQCHGGEAKGTQQHARDVEVHRRLQGAGDPSTSLEYNEFASVEVPAAADAVDLIEVMRPAVTLRESLPNG
jgi:hypothetical protein